MAISGGAICNLHTVAEGHRTLAITLEEGGGGCTLPFWVEKGKYRVMGATGGKLEVIKGGQRIILDGKGWSVGKWKWWMRRTGL